MRVIILIPFCFLVVVVSCSNVSDKEELEALDSDSTSETSELSISKEENAVTDNNDGMRIKTYSVGMRITGSEYIN